MKGKLYKDHFGQWNVKYTKDISHTLREKGLVADLSAEIEYPVNPYQRHYKGEPLKEGMEVEFIIADFWETGLVDVIKVADIQPR